MLTHGSRVCVVPLVFRFLSGFPCDFSICISGTLGQPSRVSRFILSAQTLCKEYDNERTALRSMEETSGALAKPPQFDPWSGGHGAGSGSIPSKVGSRRR